jgi:ArsR family transcriptional regulator
MSPKDGVFEMRVPQEDVESDSSTEVVVATLKALAHPIRFRILQLLADKKRFGMQDESCCARQEVCVCKINEFFDISAPTLSHHLKLLREAGLIEGRRDGVWIYYALQQGSLAVVQAALARLTPDDEA